MQTLLEPRHLDPCIQVEIIVELIIDLLSAKVCPIDPSKLDLINKLLYTNYIAPSLQEYYERAESKNNSY